MNRLPSCEALESRELLAGAPLPVGMNLANASYWSREWAFVDLFRVHSPWTPQLVGKMSPWSTGAALELTPQGYPLLADGQAAGTLMMRGTAGAYPAGRYVVTWAGDGELQFSFDAKVVSSASRRIEIDVTPSDKGIYLRIDRSNRANPVRDLRVLMPGFENAVSPFHPTFVDRLRPLESLRFMDWQRTNNSTLVHWNQRTTAQSANQGDDRGVAVELMVDLANELDADPWFCMPHLADDNFVRQFATVVKNRLEPGRKIYVEWSNEAWNPLFSQGRWVQDEALRRYGNKGLGAQVVADEALRDFDIWRDVFGADAERVVRVAAGRMNFPSYAVDLAARMNGQFDAVSAAAYFGDKGLTMSATVTAAQVLQQCLTNIESTTLPKLRQHQAIAADWSVKTGRHVAFVAYEGGQHLTASGKIVEWQAAYEKAQSHPLMYRAYQRVLEGFQEMGGELFVGFNYVSAPSRFGQWGHLTTQTESNVNAPKWQALLDAAAGLFGNDTSRPAARFVSAAPTISGATLTSLTVRYSDNVAVDAWGMGHRDVLVKGPGGLEAWATLYAFKNTAGYRTVTTTYRLAAPGGAWDKADNGKYSIYVAAGAVTDTTDNLIAGALLGSFTVAL